jgi:hypothetical protein
MTVTNQNLIQEKIKRRLNLGNACYHSIQNLLSSHLLSKKAKIKTHRTIILPVILYECETWSLIVRKQHKLQVYENRGAEENIWIEERGEVTGGWKKLHNEELHNLFSPQV